MSRLLAAAAFLLTSATATAQVLDDDLEFENHVATIELDEEPDCAKAPRRAAFADYR